MKGIYNIIYTIDCQPHILPSGVMWHYAVISSQHTYTSVSSLLRSTWLTHAACIDMQVLWMTFTEGGPYLRQPYPAGKRCAQISRKPQSWSLHRKHEGFIHKAVPKVVNWSWQPAHKTWTAWLRFPEILSHKQVARRSTHRGRCAWSCTGSPAYQ